MATTIEYALMAGASYRDTRADINRFPIPSGWNLVSRNPQDNATGFEAATFGKAMSQLRVEIAVKPVDLLRRAIQ